MMYHTSFPFLSMIQSWLSNESSYSSHPRARGLGEKYFALQIYSNITDCSRSSSPNSQPYLSSALEHLLWRIHPVVFCSLSWYAGLLPFCRKRKWLIRSWSLVGWGHHIPGINITSIACIRWTLRATLYWTLRIWNGCLGTNSKCVTH